MFCANQFDTRSLECLQIRMDVARAQQNRHARNLLIYLLSQHVNDQKLLGLVG